MWNRYKPDSACQSATMTRLITPANSPAMHLCRAVQRILFFKIYSETMVSSHVLLPY